MRTKLLVLNQLVLHLRLKFLESNFTGRNLSLQALNLMFIGRKYRQQIAQRMVNGRVEIDLLPGIPAGRAFQMSLPPQLNPRRKSTAIADERWQPIARTRRRRQIRINKGEVFSN